jgi:hypothetical protein
MPRCLVIVVSLALSLLSAAVSASTPAAPMNAASAPAMDPAPTSSPADDEIIGVYQADDPNAAGAGMQFEVAQEKGVLGLFVIADDIDCAPTPWPAGDKKASIRVYPASPVELNQRVGDRADQIHALVLEGVGVLFHAPQGWRLNENFATRTGYFLWLESDPQQMSEAWPLDVQKVKLQDLCPTGKSPK